MKKCGIIAGSTILAMLSGYGAWCMYKKLCPECADDMENGVKNTMKSMERKIEDMM